MSRYTGPKARVSRRLGINIFGTKGEMVALDKRPYPPGEHGRTRRRGNPSEYLLQLQEKQKARFSYGLTERQFRRLYEEANRRQGVTGENMLRFLELRLDNVVYRLGLATSRPQARQLVRHGHFYVNGKRADVPSYSLKEGDAVSVRERSNKKASILYAMEEVKGRGIPGWLQFDASAMTGRVASLPTREQINLPVQEQLIVELYSK